MLATIARYLSTYKTLYIRISAFSDNTMPASIRSALAKKRAQSVADLLWGNGVDSRLISSDGGASKMLASSNRTTRGRAMNRLIIVTFRHIADQYPE